MFRSAAILIVSLTLLSGCALLGLGPEPEILRSVTPHYGCPDRASKLPSLLRAASVDIDMAALPELYGITADSISGASRIIGFIPLRELVEGEANILQERHFAKPTAGEEADLTWIVEATRFSATMKNTKVQIAVSFRFRLVEARKDHERPLLDCKIEATGLSAWHEGRIPEAVYMALHRGMEGFLDECVKNRKGLEERLMTITASEGARKPKLLSFDFSEKPGGTVIGRCVVARNDMEAFKAATWAKTHIAAQCVNRFGVEADRVRVRYDADAERYDVSTGEWTFTFTAWVRSRFVPFFDKITRRGYIIVDLGLFDGTVEEASKAAKDYIVEQMNDRASKWAEDLPKAKADIEFGDIRFDQTDNLLTVQFKLLY